MTCIQVQIQIFALLLVFRDGLTILLLVSLAGIFCAFESFVLLLLIFTSGGGGFVEL